VNKVLCNFIKSIPHMSLFGEIKIFEYSKKRFDATESTFKDMVYSTDFSQLKEWMPLVMAGRIGQKKWLLHLWL
jgi:malate dehydrogenase (quinone)